MKILNTLVEFLANLLWMMLYAIATIFLIAIGWAVIVGVLYGVTAVLIASSPPAPTCLRNETVTKILELRYRDAIILLSDGTQRTVNQATLKIGSQYCAEWSKD